MKDIHELQRGDLLWIIEHAMTEEQISLELNRLYIDKALGCRDEIEALRDELSAKRSDYADGKDRMTASARRTACAEMAELEARINERSKLFSSLIEEVDRVG